jgi:hypothetical protein
MVSSSSLTHVATGLLLLLVSHGPRVVQAQTTVITNDQLASCSAAMTAVDVDLDGRINRAEYINLISALSPYPACPDTSNLLNFLGQALFSTLFQDLACQCLTEETFGTVTDVTDCCTGKNQHIKAPGVYSPAEYTVNVCTTLLETMKDECTTAAPTVITVSVEFS